MKRLIDWFVDNPVAANLLMIFIIVGGLVIVPSLALDVFPDITPDLVTVSVAWPGASPEEVEEGICVRIEEAINGIDGIKRITSIAAEDFGAVTAELYPDADRNEVLANIKSEVDALETIPEDAEAPIVRDIAMPKLVLDLYVSGSGDPVTLKRVARQVRDELAALPGLSKVELANARDDEISIEVSEDALRRYGIRFDDVVDAVRQASLNLTGGTIRTRGGEIVLRSDTQAYQREDFERILLLRSPDGTRIRVGDVATIVDELADVERESRLDGEPALLVQVFRVGEQSVPDVAEAVYRYVERKRAELPAEIQLTIGTDWADRLEERLDLLLESGLFGLLLILTVLTLFLRFRLAFWVAVGIPTAFLGTLALLPLTDVSINMMSMFGFILVLGIVVDDAIVVGENIYHHSLRGKPGPRAARDGTREVLLPIVLAVLTTMAAFIPILNLPGTMGQFANVIPVVVILALLFSLVESLLILPRHLSHLSPPARRPEGLRRFLEIHRLFGGLLAFVSRRIYSPILGLAVRWRYLTLASAAGGLLLLAAFVEAGWVGFNFFPPIAGDQVVVSLTLPPGTPAERTEDILERIEAGVEEVRGQFEGEDPGSLIRQVRTSLGVRPQDLERSWEEGGVTSSGGHLGEVFVELVPPSRRGDLPAETVMRELRRAVGPIPEALELRYDVAISTLGPAIDFELSHPDLAILRSAADDLASELSRRNGVFDISDDMLPGKRAIRLTVLPSAEALGITQAELARQIRQGFYGAEAQRLQRGPEDVKVMVRYPREERRTLSDLARVRIRLPDGGEVPFASVARTEEIRGPAVIRRSAGRRSVNVTAEVDLAVTSGNEIAGEFTRDFLPALATRYPGLTWQLEGEQREQSETMGGLIRGSLLALLLIYSFLALGFGSFLQPVVVLTAIPFGVAGAILGHGFLGRDLTLLSSVGLLAMAGVVVNDSMILVDFANRARRAGRSTVAAVLEAGPRRFRAVILTSLTTFAGLAPLLVNQSVQAQFLIPMAISLAFGVLFSTFVTLLIVPASFVVLDDGVRITRAVLDAPRRRSPEPSSATIPRPRRS